MPRKVLPLLVDAERSRGDLNTSDETSVLSEKSKIMRSLMVAGPNFHPEGNVKDRIKGLEAATELQLEKNSVVDQTLELFNTDTVKLDQSLRDLVKETTETLELELRRMKQDVDHRFDLQDAENKRLQKHVASLKAENNQLQRKLAAIEERVRNLEIEMGDGPAANSSTADMVTPFSPNSRSSTPARPLTNP